MRRLRLTLRKGRHQASHIQMRGIRRFYNEPDRIDGPATVDAMRSSLIYGPLQRTGQSLASHKDALLASARNGIRILAFSWSLKRCLAH